MPGALPVRFSYPTCASKVRPAKGRAEAGYAFVRRSRSERPGHFLTCVLRPVATSGLDSIEQTLRSPARCQADACDASSLGSRPRSDTRFHRGAARKVGASNSARLESGPVVIPRSDLTMDALSSGCPATPSSPTGIRRAREIRPSSAKRRSLQKGPSSRLLAGRLLPSPLTISCDNRLARSDFA